MSYISKQHTTMQ